MQPNLTVWSVSRKCMYLKTKQTPPTQNPKTTTEIQKDPKQTKQTKTKKTPPKPKQKTTNQKNTKL